MASMPESISRALLRKTLQTDAEFQDKMRVYIDEAQVQWDAMAMAPISKVPRRWDAMDPMLMPTRTFYDNRLHFDIDGGLWFLADITRQCSCCGNMSATNASLDNNGRMLSCATCKVIHYCDRVCQKRDWKQRHKSVCRPAKGKEGLEVVMHICVRALTLMRLTVVADDGSERLTLSSPESMGWMFAGRSDSTSQQCFDLENAKYPAGKDRVSQHFRRQQESNCILCPIWETATDNLAFVPISLDFMSIGLGAPDALVESFKTTMLTNANTYFVLVMGRVRGKLAVVGGSSFVVIANTPQMLGQEGEGAK